jgi:hypothetical protein
LKAWHVSRLRQLDALASLLAGRLPRRVDWTAVLALANESLVTPQVYAAALRSGAAGRLPRDAQVFLAEVWRRNRIRNRRLFAQLEEVLAVLNAAGVEPLLFKGAAHWVSIGRPADYDRMLNDLDLIVPPDQEAAARDALCRAGFQTLRRFPPDAHWIAEFGRPEDAGLVDLHRRPPGPKAFALEAVSAPGQSLPVAWSGVRARRPTAALQIFLLVLHDQFQDGGYWRGEFALRHLLDIAELTQRPEGVDWGELARLARGRVLANATESHLLAAARMCAARTPAPRSPAWVNLQHARRRAQFRWPAFAPALRRLAG